MTKLNPQQFAQHQPHRVEPVHAKRQSLYPQSQPDFDSPTYTSVTDVAGLQAAVNRPTAKRYDEEKGFVRANVDHYLLHRPSGESVKIPVRWKIPEGYDPLQ